MGGEGNAVGEKVNNYYPKRLTFHGAALSSDAMGLFCYAERAATIGVLHAMVGLRSRSFPQPTDQDGNPSRVAKCATAFSPTWTVSPVGEATHRAVPED